MKILTKIFPKKFTKHSHAGFTILETLIAISILVLALTGPIAIVAQALRSSYFSRDQITAYYLAQEAIEYLRNKRDNSGLQQSTGADQWTELMTTDTGVNMVNAGQSTTLRAYLVRDFTGYALKQCVLATDPSPCPYISYNTDAFDPESSAVLYGDVNSTEASNFIREIIVNEPPAGTSETSPGLRELVVTVNVFWRLTDGTFAAPVTIREHMTNWQLEKQDPESGE